MSFNIINEDLRSIKTKKALHEAMFSLLKKFNFKKITIKGICEEALISRAAFYAHFVDKYDLLKNWVTELWPKNLSNHTYAQVEKQINAYATENVIILKNLVSDADNETLAILFDVISSAMNLTVGKSDSGEMNVKNVVLSNFYAGGMITYLAWQVRNKLPPDAPLMNRYFYEMIRMFKDWQSE